MGQSQPLIKLIGSRVILVFFLYPIHHANKRSLSHDLLLKWVGCYHVHWLLRIKHRHHQHSRIYLVVPPSTTDPQRPLSPINQNSLPTCVMFRTNNTYIPRLGGDSS